MRLSRLILRRTAWSEHGMGAACYVCIGLNAAHSCSRHGVVAVRLTSERPGSVIPLSKNIYCTGSTFVTSVTVDVFETGRKRSSVLPSCSLPREQFSSNLVTTTVCIHSVQCGDHCHVRVKTVIKFKCCTKRGQYVL
jgi:hypothetical protein